MSDFKAKMHQIRFRLGLRPRPRWGSLQRSPDPLAGFEGPTSKREEGREKGKEREGGGRRREGRRGLSGSVAEEAFCLKSAPVQDRKLNKRNRELLSRDPVFYPEQPIVTTEMNISGQVALWLGKDDQDP